MNHSREFDEALLVFPSLEGIPPPVTAASPRFVDRMLVKVRGWYHLAHSRFELTELNDHLLKDIGLTRSQALVEGRKFFWHS